MCGIGGVPGQLAAAGLIACTLHRVGGQALPRPAPRWDARRTCPSSDCKQPRGSPRRANDPSAFFKLNVDHVDHHVHFTKCHHGMPRLPISHALQWHRAERVFRSKYVLAQRTPEIREKTQGPR